MLEQGLSCQQIWAENHMAVSVRRVRILNALLKWREGNLEDLNREFVRL